MNKNLFDSNFESTFKLHGKNIKRAVFVLMSIWIIGVSLSLGLIGVIIWAIIKLVHEAIVT